MVQAYFSGIRERQRLGSLRLTVGAASTIFDDENEKGMPSMSEENAEMRRPKLFWLNAGLTIALMTGLVVEVLPLLLITRVIVHDHRWQASSYKGPRNTCRSRLAGDGLKCVAFILITRVIVNDHR
jgi:hypothetical protein